MAGTQARSGLLQATQVAENNPGDANVMATLASSQATLESAMGGFNLKMEDYPASFNCSRFSLNSKFCASALKPNTPAKITFGNDFLYSLNFCTKSL
jgi:hypothetical protein